MAGNPRPTFEILRLLALADHFFSLRSAPPPPSDKHDTITTLRIPVGMLVILLDHHHKSLQMNSRRSSLDRRWNHAYEMGCSKWSSSEKVQHVQMMMLSIRLEPQRANRRNTHCPEVLQDGQDSKICQKTRPSINFSFFRDCILCAWLPDAEQNCLS